MRLRSSLPASRINRLAGMIYLVLVAVASWSIAACSGFVS
jgi:hypothetical protein